MYVDSFESISWRDIFFYLNKINEGKSRFYKKSREANISILKRRDLSHLLSHVDSQIKSISEDDNIFFSHLHLCRISLHLPSLLCTTDHQGRNEPCLRWFDAHTTWNWTSLKDPGAATFLNFVDHVDHVNHADHEDHVDHVVHVCSSCSSCST